MKWQKMGLIFKPTGEIKWMETHAMMPVVYKLNHKKVRIYFSPRDKINRSRPASIDLEFDDDGHLYLSNLSKKPILNLGSLGAFDDSGIMPTSIITYGKELYLYYNGWTLGKNVPFFSFNGLAISNDGGKTFKKVSRGPTVLYRNEIDPFSTFTPFVLIDEGKWRMWYVSCIKWVIEKGIPKHYYHIKYAESYNGIDWIRNGYIAIDFKNSYEYAIARPMIIKKNDLYKMWYSYRASKINKTYRIGYAESIDGLNWRRKDDEVGIDVSKHGWDNEMICYAFIFNIKNEIYMVYNGNSYGKTGFGIAKLIEE